jgi:GTP-binding protein
LSSIQQARFLVSAAAVQDFPPADGPEIAFAGRSNVGKSSAINALAGRRRLAFSSKTPGRTQMINFFQLGEAGRLADLPGYGYASVPQALRATWDALIGGYLSGREALAGVVVLMDARHPLTSNDRNFLEWLRPVAVPRLVLLSKADKLSRAERLKTLASTRAALDKAALTSQVVLFSSKSGEGVEETRTLLDAWLGHKKPPEKGN